MRFWPILTGDYRYLIDNSCSLLRNKALISQPGKLPMKTIYMQSGEFVDEGDIVMFDDVFGRK